MDLQSLNDGFTSHVKLAGAEAILPFLMNLIKSPAAKKAAPWLMRGAAGAGAYHAADEAGLPPFTRVAAGVGGGWLADPSRLRALSKMPFHEGAGGLMKDLLMKGSLTAGTGAVEYGLPIMKNLHASSEGLKNTLVDPKTGKPLLGDAIKNLKENGDLFARMATQTVPKLEATLSGVNSLVPKVDKGIDSAGAALSDISKQTGRIGPTADAVASKLQSAAGKLKHPFTNDEGHLNMAGKLGIGIPIGLVGTYLTGQYLKGLGEHKNKNHKR